MKNKNSVKDSLFGKNREEMPDIAFHMMAFTMKVMDFFRNYSGKNFETLGLASGQTVIDYGCGPARYIRNAARVVGESGRVIAVDIHPLAIKKVEERIRKFGLTNVEAVLAEGYQTPIDAGTADVVYALDMFHMVCEPEKLMTELARLVKPDGMIIIEDGHQPRKETLEKIEGSGILKIIDENKFHVRCQKIN